jgi:hypothetical protein
VCPLHLVLLLLRHWADLAKTATPPPKRQYLQLATDASREQFAAMLGYVSRLLTIEGASGGKTVQLSVISADGEDAPLGDSEPDLRVRGGAVQSCTAAAAS